jgi:hypothetical protein
MNDLSRGLISFLASDGLASVKFEPRLNAVIDAGEAFELVSSESVEIQDVLRKNKTARLASTKHSHNLLPTNETVQPWSNSRNDR